MLPRSRLFLPALLLATVALGACNLVFSIKPGELFATGGGTPGTGGASSTGGTAGNGGKGGTGGTAGDGGAGGSTPCAPSTAACEGAILHACDADGHSLPDIDCKVLAACDSSARACIPAAGLPRLSIGSGRTCAIADDRSVRCWGVNFSGIVPNDPRLTLPTATPVEDVSGARQVAVATGHACVLHDDGTVTCWGSNDSGETGVPAGSPITPAKVTMPGSIPALELGAAHRCSCARLATGAIACWGQENTGCFGNASQIATVTPTPTLVPGVAKAVQLRVGSYEAPTCARLASGKVMCWNGSTTPTEIAGVDDATDLTIGRGTVFIRSATKGLFWSASTQGGFTAASPYAAASLTSMSAGDAFCGLRDDGAVLCTLLGNPPPLLPKLVLKLPLGTIVEIAAGYSFNYGVGLQCLRLEGASLASRVYCWGDDFGGALGAGTPEDFRVPQTVPGISGATSLSSAVQSTSVVLGNGTVAYWGASSALDGVGSETPKVVGTLGNDNAKVVVNEVAARAYVLKTTGVLTLLDGGAFKPNERLLKGGSADFAAAQGWYLFDIGLKKTDGSIVVFGDDATSNTSGIFGDGTTQSVAGQLASVPGVSMVSAIASHGEDYNAEPAHACAILGPGGVSCWGNNFAGEIGSGPTGATVSTPLAVAIPGGEPIASIAVGRVFTCAATVSGKVYCWGQNDWGQLGADTAMPFSQTPIQVAGISNALGVTARNAHACAWLADKTAVCWGENGEGEVGDGTIEPRFAPVVVSGLSDVVELSAGSHHTCARHTGGTISCWGSSYGGQVGTGVIGIFEEPLMVLDL